MKQRNAKRRIHPDTVTLIKQIALGVMVVGVVALLLYGVWYGTRHPGVTIDTVNVSGGETIDHKIIEERVWQQLEGEYVRLIPRTFSYLYPRDDILSSLGDIDRIKEVTVDRVGRKKLDVSFVEYVASALWCSSDSEECFFVDETSFAFAAAPSLVGGSFLRYVTTEREPVLGASVVNNSELEVLTMVINELESRGWLVRSVDVDLVGDAYIDLAAGSEVKIALGEEAANTVANLDAVLQSEEFASLTPGEFQYIDLRFGNKVFVNRVEEVATSTETSIVEFELVEEAVEESAVLNEESQEQEEDTAEQSEEAVPVAASSTVTTSTTTSEEADNE